MDKNRVLFICGHNSGRSQMAEAFLNKIGGHKMHIESAGLEPKPINPLVVEVMQEIGYDLSLFFMFRKVKAPQEIKKIKTASRMT